jgi:hypothetical protein
MAVAVLVNIVLGDSLAPRGAALKLDMFDVDSSVNDIWMGWKSAQSL